LELALVIQKEIGGLIVIWFDLIEVVGYEDQVNLADHFLLRKTTAE